MTRSAILVLFLFVTTLSSALAQPTPDPHTPIPLDPAVVTGRLPNGIVYYIRHNERPKNRADLRLVINAGSLLEDDDQQGLAHLLEHMAFNGTKNFQKGELVAFLESIGIRFGPDLNAYTSFDETVYMLQVPTDTARFLATGIQILEDWAHNLTLDAEEIDRERGVVREEWRLGRGADDRIRDKQLPVAFGGSRYAQRLPIGKLEVIQGASHDAVRRYYRDWYRPDLMAVIAVGDFDVQNVERLIRTHFSSIAAPHAPRPRVTFEVPSPERPRTSIVTDPEATAWKVDISYMLDKGVEGTVGTFRQDLIENLFADMFNARFNELRLKPDAPLLYGYGTRSGWNRAVDFFSLRAAAKEGQVVSALELLLTELERVRRHGFAESEFERSKTGFRRMFERAYEERDKAESNSFVWEYQGHYLRGSAAASMEQEYALFNQLLPTITLQEVERLVGEYTTGQPVVMVSGPDKPSAPPPSSEQLLATIDRVSTVELKPWVDTQIDRPLVSAELKAKPVRETRTFESLGITRWQLANGVTVYAKPTDFKNDQLMFSAFSPGGTSRAADEGFVNAVVASSIVGEAGVGDFSQIELTKALTGTSAYVSPYISERLEGLTGGGSPRDVETLMQLIYLRMTSPRRDEDVFQSYLSRAKEGVRNRSARPETAFGDTLRTTLTGYHPRHLPWSESTYDQIDLDRVLAFYRDRFADASDFTFVFVGNVDLDTLRPLVETYLANLPTSGREEAARDIIVGPPDGVIEKSVFRGLEPKSRVSIVFTDTIGESSPEIRGRFSALASALQIRLRELLREDKGGTYSVGVRGSVDREPRPEYTLSISFGCDPDRVEELTADVFEQIERAATEGFDEATVDKVRESRRRALEIGMRENGYWLSRIENTLIEGEQLESILDEAKRIEALSPQGLQELARRYLHRRDHVRVVLYPEDYRERIEASGN